MGRIEAGQIAIERWAQEDGNYHRSPSVRERHHYGRREGPRQEENDEAELEREEERSNGHADYWGRRFHDSRGERRRYDRRYDEDHHEDRRGNRAHDRGPRRPRVEFPKFDGGDPYEWLDKADHYFRSYEVPRQERVSIACFLP